MIDLTQQLLDDFKPYVREKFWDDFVRIHLEDSKPENDGPIVNILINYYPGTDRIASKIYQRESHLGTPHGLKLDATRVGVDSL